jgi:hypothetical protein
VGDLQKILRIDFRDFVGVHKTDLQGRRMLDNPPEHAILKLVIPILVLPITVRRRQLNGKGDLR